MSEYEFSVYAIFQHLGHLGSGTHRTASVVGEKAAVITSEELDIKEHQ